MAACCKAATCMSAPVTAPGCCCRICWRSEGSGRDLTWHTWHLWHRVYVSLYAPPAAEELLPLPGEPPLDYSPPPGVKAPQGGCGRASSSSSRVVAGLPARPSRRCPPAPAAGCWLQRQRGWAAAVLLSSSSRVATHAQHMPALVTAPRRWSPCVRLQRTTAQWWRPARQRRRRAQQRRATSCAQATRRQQPRRSSVAWKCVRQGGMEAWGRRSTGRCSGAPATTSVATHLHTHLLAV